MKLLFQAFSLAICTSANAYVLDVKSGEHDNFSRLVFYHPGNVQMDLSQTDGGFSVGSSRKISELQADDVFTRISKNRISRIFLSEGRAFIDLTCECEIDLQELESGISFVDVKNSTSKVRKIPEFSSEDSGTSASLTKLALPILNSRQGLPPTPTKSDHPRGDKIVNSSSLTASSSTEKNILSAFLSGISTASLIETQEKENFSQVNQPQITLEPTEFRSPLGYLQFEGSPESSTPTDRNCDAGSIESLLDFSNNDELKYDQLSSFRKKAVSGDMVLRSQGAEGLAKFYLSNGFIEEAIYYTNWMEDTPKKNVLQEISFFLTFDEPERTKALQHYSSCSNHAAFWFFLTDSEAELPLDIPISELTLYFRSLPFDLFRLLEPVLNMKVSEAGYLEALPLLSLGSSEQNVGESAVNIGKTKEKGTLENPMTSAHRMESDYSGDSTPSRYLEKLHLEERIDREIEIKLSLDQSAKQESQVNLAHRYLDVGNTLAAVAAALEMGNFSEDFIQGDFFERFLKESSGADLILLEGMPDYDDFLDLLLEKQREILLEKGAEARKILDTTSSKSSKSETISMPTSLSPTGENQLKTDQDWAGFYKILEQSEAVRREAAALINP